MLKRLTVPLACYAFVALFFPLLNGGYRHDAFWHHAGMVVLAMGSHWTPSFEPVE